MPASPPVLTLEDVARGAPLDLDLDAGGTPRRPVVLVDLGPAASMSPEVRALAADRLACALPVVVGVDRDAPLHDGTPCETAAWRPCDVVLCGYDRTDRNDRVPDAHVAVEDAWVAAAALADAIASAPRAAVALTALLRQTDALDVRSGLLAESATYSTLLAGPEFARWRRSRAAPRPPDDSAPLGVEREADVLRLTLTRPARRNAVTARLRDELVDALAIAHADPSLTVEIAAEGPDFSTGGDLDEFGTAPDVATAHVIRSDRSVGWAIHQIRDRVHVRMHGRAQGSGLEMPAFAGHVVASPDATFELPELALGLVPGAGGTVSVTKRIGRWRTAWLALSGAAVDVPTALAWGLIDDRT